MLVILTSCSSSNEAAQAPAPASRAETTTTSTSLHVAGWEAVATPANGGNADVQWFRSANGQLVAVALPDGTQAFPLVVYYHGSSGLASIQVDWSVRLADAGYAVVTGCWNPGVPAAVQCPNVSDPGAGVTALFDFATNMPGADLERLAVMGVSSGVAPAALTPDPRVGALVADSGLTAGQQLPDLVAPILVLASSLDPVGPSVQEWANRLQDAGETVEIDYLDIGGHVVTLQPGSIERSTADVVDFLRDKLG